MSLLMAKGNVSTTKGKATKHTKAPVKKSAPKKAQHQKVTSKKKGHQKRAATESLEEDSDEESEHRAQKRKCTKKDTSDSEEVVEVNDPAKENETVGKGDEVDSNEPEVRILKLVC